MGTTFGTPTQSFRALRTFSGRGDEQNQCWLVLVDGFVGLAYQEGKDIVFRFIIEYSSLRDFGP
jgi:hypothetical protein